MTSTTQRGAIFSEDVARLLCAAGFEATTEVHVVTKNVDVVGTFARDTLAGPVRYAFEAKDHEGTPPWECHA